MIRYSLFEMCMAIAAVAFAASAPAAETKDRGILFSEGFDDQNVVKRGWYDSVKIRISNKDAYAGAGCIEYEWEDGGKAVGSRGLRHLFEPTEVVYIRENDKWKADGGSAVGSTANWSSSEPASSSARPTTRS